MIPFPKLTSNKQTIISLLKTDRKIGFKWIASKFTQSSLTFPKIHFRNKKQRLFCFVHFLKIMQKKHFEP